MSEAVVSVADSVQAVDVCDLCGTADLQEVAEAARSRCRTVMCRNCGLLFASPSLPREALQDFYDDEFDGDAGTNVRTGEQGIAERKIRQETRLARDWAMPIIEQHLDVAGAKILEVRCRSGALAELLSAAGAEVTAIDPLQPNVDHASGRGTIAKVKYLPILDFFRLKENGLEGFDAISLMTIHTLGHLPSPREFLDGLFAALKPGGMLFLDEKDVYHPVNTTGPTLFDTGTAHFFHFSAETLRIYLERAGFEVVECALDPVRKKAFRHIRTVARRPLEGGAANDRGNGPYCDADERLEKLALSESRLQRRVVFNRAKRKAKAAVRKLVSQR